MSGKVVLITGAGRGIGRGIAMALASAGATVALSDIDEAVAETAAQEIRQAGGRAAAFGGDVTDLSLPKRLIEQTVATLGGLHVLVNNASVQTEKPWLQLSAADIQRDFNADIAAPILLCQQAVPILKSQRYGRIVNIGSIQQRRGNSSMLAYSLSKAALEKFTTAIARQLAPDGITVNMIAPGWFNTYRNEHDLSRPGILEERGKHVPFGRIGEPQDCAGAALLLCSDAGQYITGQTLYVDGGMSA